MDINTIQIWSIIVSIILAIASFVAILITVLQNKKILKQNQEILDSANRPYISFYMKKTYIKGTCQNFIIIKNFGKSAGLIKSIKCSINIEKYFFLDKFNPIEKCVNVTICPDQSFVIPVNAKEMSYDNVGEIKFYITYSSLYSKEDIVEEHNINYEFIRNNMAQGSPRQKNEGNLEDDLRIVSDILHEDLIEKL